MCTNNEKNDQFYRKVAFLMYSERVNFRPQSWKEASKLKPDRGDVVYQFMKHTARNKIPTFFRRLMSACECFFVHWCDKISWLENILLKLCVRTSCRYHIIREDVCVYYIYVCVWCDVCICIYEQKFIMAEIMRMRMFKVLLTSVWVKIQ